MNNAELASELVKLAQRLVNNSDRSSDGTPKSGDRTDKDGAGVPLENRSLGQDASNFEITKESLQDLIRQTIKDEMKSSSDNGDNVEPKNIDIKESVQQAIKDLAPQLGFNGHKSNVLTGEDLDSMSRKEINANWDKVQVALADGGR